ncbi:MAG: c-type cytochrome biogenesis protein CcsB [Anaerolineae bacterium]
MNGGTFLLLALLWATVAYGVHLSGARRGWGALGTLLVLVAWAALTVGLVVRGTRAGHWPLTNRFEFALCWVWAILTFYLLLERSLETHSGGAFVLPPALLLALWATRRPEAEQLIRPLAPALQSNWFPLHVGCSAIAYGAFVVAGGLGALFLVGECLRQEGFIEVEPTARFPSSRRMAYLIWRAVGLGFPWLTLGMFSGAIWAQVAWGRYWDWDPKESWTLITWLTYLILLHGRALRGWRERCVAWLAIVGAGVVGFTFLGVGWLVRALRLESVHIF